MTARKWTGVTAVLLLAGVSGWNIYRAVQQEQLDEALITAVKHNDARIVASLLAHGADPNARDRPKPSLSFWRLLLHRLQGKRPLDSWQRTALQIAVQKDLADSQEANVLIIQALLTRGAERGTGQAKAIGSLDWADRLLRSAPDLPPMSDDSPDLDGVCSEAREAFQSILLKYGGCERGYAEIGECLLRQGKYEEAVHALRLALIWMPSNAVARASLQHASQLLQISQTAARQLPTGNRVLSVRAYPIRERSNLWLVLYGVQEYMSNDDGSAPIPLATSNVHLALYSIDAKHFARIWQSGAIRMPDFVYDEVHDAQAFVLDLNGDGVSEVIVHEDIMAADRVPTHMEVFSYRPNGLSRLLEVSTNGEYDALWLHDIKHNGRYEICRRHEIGSMYPPSDRPLWTDIYAYKAGRYVPANQDFPDEFEGARLDLEATLRKYPHDHEILAHRGMLEEIERRPQQALTSYRKAARECAFLLKSTSDAGYRDFLSGQRGEIRTRIRALIRRSR